MNLQSKFIYEKYSLQKYESKIVNLVAGDMNQLNSIAILVCLCIYRFNSFCVQRTIKLDDTNITLSYVLYDSDYDTSKVASSASKVLDSPAQVGPDQAEGYTYDDTVLIYVPISLEDTPFTSKKLNSYITDEVCTKVSNKFLSSKDYIIKETNSNSIIDVTSFKLAHKDAIEAILNVLPSDSKPVQSLFIRVEKVIQSAKHELTHVLDGLSGIRGLNHFSSLPVNLTKISKHDRLDLEEAIELLYSLWSYTEFSAFTQTYGKQSSKANGIVDQDSIKKLSSKIIGRPIGKKETQTLDDYISELHTKLANVSSNSNNNFWSTIQDIVINGSSEQSHKDRISSMSEDKFKKYFIYTTLKLIDKFKEKTIKNIASQSEYESDINRIAVLIKNECERNNDAKESSLSLKLKFNYYFSEFDQSYQVKLQFVTGNLKNKEDSTISNNTNVTLNIQSMNLLITQTVDSMFGSTNSYTELYRELKRPSGFRKTYLDKLCYNLANDIKLYLDNNI